MNYKNLPEGWLKQEDAEFLVELVEYTIDLEEFSLEIGSWYGRSTVVIGQEIQKCGGQLFCIDTWNQEGWKETARKLPKNRQHFQWEKSGGNAYLIFWQNIEKHGLAQTVHPIIGRSSDIRKKWDAPLQFIFVDGCHYYEFVKNDALWKEFLVKDGIIAFHDYGGNGWPGVKKAVDEMMDPDTRFQFFKQVRHLRAFKRISK